MNKHVHRPRSSMQEREKINKSKLSSVLFQTDTGVGNNQFLQKVNLKGMSYFRKKKGMNRSVSVRKYSGRYSRANRQNISTNYSLKTLKRNAKARQILEDLDPNTVENGLEEMKLELEDLVLKAEDADDGEYMAGEEADEQIESIQEANHNLLRNLGSVAKLVTSAIK